MTFWKVISVHYRSKGSKYNSRTVELDGMIFDSAKEYRRFCELSLLEKAGAISGLQRQVKFELIPQQREESTEVFKKGKNKGLPKPGKLLEPSVCYVADFVYFQDGERIVEDVKGYKKGAAYNIFVIKRKLMLYFHDIRIREV